MQLRLTKDQAFRAFQASPAEGWLFDVHLKNRENGTLNAVEILDTMSQDAFRLWVASGICLHSQQPEKPEKPELDKLAALYFKLAPALPSSNKYECALRIQRVSSVIRRL